MDAECMQGRLTYFSNKLMLENHSERGYLKTKAHGTAEMREIIYGVD
jgi:hypothetical protein